MLSKKIIILLLLGVLVGSVIVAAYPDPVTSALGVGITLIKSAVSSATGVLSVGFSLLKTVVSPATDVLSVGFSLLKEIATPVTDVLSVGFSLAKAVISTATSTIGVGITLIKSAVSSATGTLAVGFTLIKEGVFAVTNTVGVGITLIKGGITTVSDTIVVGFTLIKEGLLMVVYKIGVGITLISPGPTPTPTPTPVSFSVSALSNCPVHINQTAQFNATISGADATPPYTHNWAFGDGDETTGQSVSHVYPAYWRSWHAVVTVSDSAGHTAQDTVKCCIHRIKTDETTSNIDDSAYYALLDAISGEVEGEPINESAIPDFLKFAESVTTPYTNIVGNLFFMIFFSAFFLMIWIRQENLAIPSTIGIITGGYILGFAPPEFRLTAILFVSLSIFGIIYMLLKERN